MFETLKKQVLIQYELWILMYVFVLAGSLFGNILFLLLMKFDSTANTTFTLGTVMGIIISIIYLFIMQAVQLSLYFNLEVSMGCTRRRFLVSEYVAAFAAGLVGLGVVVVIQRIETGWIKRIYPDLPSEINLLPYLLKWGIPAVAALVILAGFCSAMVMRFKRKAFWVFWVLWMFVCLCVPRIHDAAKEAPNSLFGRIGRFVVEIVGIFSARVWLALAVLLCVLMTTVTYQIIRRQQVEI